MTSTRRNFIKTTSIPAAGSVLYPDAFSDTRANIAPGDNIQVELIGANEMAYTVGLDLHLRNFLDCIRNNTREKLNADISMGRNVALVTHLGNIAYHTEAKVF